MENRILNKIMELLREQMAGAPTMHVGNTGYTSKGNQVTAGFNPVQGKLERRKKPKYMKLPSGMRKRWKKGNESK